MRAPSTPLLSFLLLASRKSHRFENYMKAKASMKEGTKRMSMDWASLNLAGHSQTHNSVCKCICFTYRSGVGAGFRWWLIEECQRAAVSNDQDRCHWCGLAAGWHNKLHGMPSLQIGLLTPDGLSRCCITCSLLWLVVCLLTECRGSFVHICWRSLQKWVPYEKAPVVLDSHPVLMLNYYKLKVSHTNRFNCN